MKDLKQFIKTTIREFLNETYDGRFDDEYDFTKHNLILVTVTSMQYHYIEFINIHYVQLEVNF